MWPKTLIESDNQRVIEALRGGNQHWMINQIIGDIQISSSFLPSCGFLWTRREGNDLAHGLAHLTMEEGRSFFSPASIPPSLKEIATTGQRSASRNLTSAPSVLPQNNEP
ncbi:Reverse transcriptase-like [Sesbania bispinosa]|nr:Reverse transcriptase-like [Sesbania bispinosa]